MTVADFVMEMGLKSELPTYSGGLGTLAGDFAFSLADLGFPTVFVTLLYKKGYTSQRLDKAEGQLDSGVMFDPAKYLTPLDARVKVEIADRIVEVGAWEYRIKGKSEVPVLFLDTDLPENDAPEREITDRLYGGDRTHRLEQEMVLGIGGYRMLKELGYDIEVYHLNESHAALLTVELVRSSENGEARKRCVFTTHTPVAAGHESFPLSMVRFAFLKYDWIDWAAKSTDERVDLTRLALEQSDVTNAVSLKHRYVSQSVLNRRDIEYVTNGVYHKRWIHDELKRLYNRYLPGWEETPSLLNGAFNLPTEELSLSHKSAKSELLEMLEDRTGERLDADRLTIGMAKRVTGYKRNDLILLDLERLIGIAKRAGPLQIFFAGKSHPNDDIGKAMLRDILRRAEEIRNKTNLIRVVYLENYDLSTAKSLVAGCDLWLNTPRRPWEACGTSGMKAAMNGVLNFSVNDGWWSEGGIEGVNGWGIGRRTEWNDVSQGSDSEDSEDVYGKLSYAILPAYYRNREKWWEMAKSSIATVGPLFNSYRMVGEYAARVFKFGVISKDRAATPVADDQSPQAASVERVADREVDEP